VERIVEVFDQQRHARRQRTPHDRRQDHLREPAGADRRGRHARLLHDIERIGAPLERGDIRRELGDVRRGLDHLIGDHGPLLAQFLHRHRVEGGRQLAVDGVELQPETLQFFAQPVDFGGRQVDLALLLGRQVGGAVDDQLAGDFVGHVRCQHRIGVLDLQHQQRRVLDNPRAQHPAERARRDGEIARLNRRFEHVVGFGEHGVILDQLNARVQVVEVRVGRVHDAAHRNGDARGVDVRLVAAQQIGRPGSQECAQEKQPKPFTKQPDIGNQFHESICPFQRMALTITRALP